MATIPGAPSAGGGGVQTGDELALSLDLAMHHDQAFTIHSNRGSRKWTFEHIKSLTCGSKPAFQDATAGEDFVLAIQSYWQVKARCQNDLDREDVNRTFLASTFNTGAAVIHVIRDLFTNDASNAMDLHESDESWGTGSTWIIRLLLSDVYHAFFAKFDTVVNTERGKGAEEAAQRNALLLHSLNNRYSLGSRLSKLSRQTPGLHEFASQVIESVNPISYSPASITSSDAAAQDHKLSEEIMALRQDVEALKSTAESSEMRKTLDTLKTTVDGLTVNAMPGAAAVGGSYASDSFAQQSDYVSLFGDTRGIGGEANSSIQDIQRVIGDMNRLINAMRFQMTHPNGVVKGIAQWSGMSLAKSYPKLAQVPEIPWAAPDKQGHISSGGTKSKQ